jgi:flagellar hook-basal body complex protein FliE
VTSGITNRQKLQATAAMVLRDRAVNAYQEILRMPI